jgi:hypothetical protein
MSEADLLLYSSLAGFAVTYAVDLLFPDDIQFKVADGWNIRFEPSVQ